VNVASIEEVTEEVGQSEGGVGDNGGTTFCGRICGGKTPLDMWEELAMREELDMWKKGTNLWAKMSFSELQDENANFIE